MKVVREELPSKLFRNNFAIKLPDQAEESDDTTELEDIESEDVEDYKMIVIMKGADCQIVEEGDEVLIPAGAYPRLQFSTIEGDYAVFSENDVIAIW
jgi:hypothetical protein